MSTNKTAKAFFMIQQETGPMYIVIAVYYNTTVSIQRSTAIRAAVPFFYKSVDFNDSVLVLYRDLETSKLSVWTDSSDGNLRKATGKLELIDVKDYSVITSGSNLIIASFINAQRALKVFVLDTSNLTSKFEIFSYGLADSY